MLCPIHVFRSWGGAAQSTTWRTSADRRLTTTVGRPTARPVGAGLMSGPTSSGQRTAGTSAARCTKTPTRPFVVLFFSLFFSLFFFFARFHHRRHHGAVSHRGLCHAARCSGLIGVHSGVAVSELGPTSFRPSSAAVIDDDAHGQGGPLTTSIREPVNPIAEAFVSACNSAGHATVDYNAGGVRQLRHRR